MAGIKFYVIGLLLGLATCVSGLHSSRAARMLSACFPRRTTSDAPSDAQVVAHTPTYRGSTIAAQNAARRRAWMASRRKNSATFNKMPTDAYPKPIELLRHVFDTKYLEHTTDLQQIPADFNFKAAGFKNLRIPNAKNLSDDQKKFFAQSGVSDPRLAGWHIHHVSSNGRTQKVENLQQLQQFVSSDFHYSRCTICSRTKTLNCVEIF